MFRSVEDELHPLEDEINEWIAQSGARVISITGNIAPQTNRDRVGTFASSDVFVIVLYESGPTHQS